VFCEHSGLYSEIWPTLGSMRNGRAYAHSTSALRMDGSGSSSSLGLLGTPRCSDGIQYPLREGVTADPRGRLEDQIPQLLPTPRATDGTKGGPNQRGSSGDLMLPSAVHALLPTPTAHDWKASGPSQADRHSPMLSEIGLLLPTPTVMDFKASGGNSGHSQTLTDVVVRTSLGARTNPRFAAGNKSSADPHPRPQNPPDETAVTSCPPDSTSG
jgi:hypothetical protein